MEAKETRTTLQIDALGHPKAQGRPRATIRRRRAGGLRAGVHNPTGANAWKATIARAAKRLLPDGPLDGPIRVDIVFRFPRPKRLQWKTKPMPRLRHTGKPDRDNLDKAVLDALNGIAWKDDAQVCDGRLEKWIAGGDERPGATITITQLTRTST